MQVRDLIEQLQRFNPKSEVEFHVQHKDMDRLRTIILHTPNHSPLVITDCRAGLESMDTAVIVLKP